jgi:hypothetical protein
LALAVGGGGAAAGAAGLTPGAPWTDYQIIVWQRQTAAGYRALQGIGVTAGAVHRTSSEHPEQLDEAAIAALRANGMRWYVENIATDFYSAYHRWFPGRPVNWRFREVKRRYEADPLDPAAFIREPSLADRRWRNLVGDRLRRIVRERDRDRPLFYNLADEPGIGDLSIAWDFDYSPASLGGLRRWLQRRYGSLAALNRQWDSRFGDWSAVAPMSTREALARQDQNYSAWMDFKEWMDEAFAEALKAGTDAAHAASPRALTAIEGGQIPGWGGYDYARLAHAVDVMELYDDGGNLEIARALNPDLVLLTTSAEGGAREAHRAWRELLRGTRGIILWDAKDELVAADGTPGERARDAAQTFQEIRGGLGALLINSVRETDPIAILYSPASFRLQWLLDWRDRGDAWARRDIESAYEDASEVRASMMAYARTLERSGLHPRFLSSDDLAKGALTRGKYRALILPHVLSLAPRASAAVRRFAAQGGLVIADVPPGAFDGHGRRLPRASLTELFPAGSAGPRPPRRAAAYLPPGDSHALARALRQHGVVPEIGMETAEGAAGDVETFRFRTGGVRLIALQRELSAAAAPRDRVRLTLPHPAWVYDLRRHRPLGRHRRLSLSLEPIGPTILALAAAPLPALTLNGPSRARLGTAAVFRAGYGAPPPASPGVLHVEVSDPFGQPVPGYGGNVLTSARSTALRLRPVRNATPGTWTIRVTDVLTGKRASGTVEFGPAGRGYHFSECELGHSGACR